MSQPHDVDTEQIGPLVFVANQNYPYPFKTDKPPRYWMEEQTGALATAVETYMNGDRLSAEQLELIKLYLTQYIERVVLTADAQRQRLLSRIAKLRTNNDIETFADHASEYGAEVF